MRGKHGKIFKVYLAIFQHYAWKGSLTCTENQLTAFNMMETLKLIKEFTIVEKWPLFVTLFLRALISRKRFMLKLFLTPFCNLAKMLLTSFVLLVSFYTPLKVSEKLWFSNVFRGYRKRQVPWNRLRPLQVDCM